MRLLFAPFTKYFAITIIHNNTSVNFYRSIVKNYEIILLYYYKHNFHASLL